MTNQLEAPRLPRWLDRLVDDFERYVVEIENHRVHVMEYGRGPRTVLCLHGNPTWGFLYRKVARELDPVEFRVIMPDLVGLGWSSRPQSSHAHTLENHARWTTKLIDALQIEDYTLVVQDWGGAIGLLGARGAQSEPAALMLMNTAFAPPRPGFRPTAFHHFSQMPLVSDAVFRVGNFPQNILHRVRGDSRKVSKDERRAYTTPLGGPRRNGAVLALARMVPDSQGHPSIEPLGVAREYALAFDGPIAGLWGVNDPVLGSLHRYYQKILPQMRMIETSASHFPQEEVPGPIARQIEWASRSASE